MLKVRVRTQYGELEVSGDSPKELLEALDGLDAKTVAEINDRVSGLVAADSRDHLRGIVEARRDGPLVTYRGELSHYEAIALILYASRNYQATGAEVKRSLAASSLSIVAPARLNEMAKRGIISRPPERSGSYRLTPKGIKWVEDEVVPPLRERLAQP